MQRPSARKTLRRMREDRRPGRRGAACRTEGSNPSPSADVARPGSDTPDASRRDQGLDSCRLPSRPPLIERDPHLAAAEMLLDEAVGGRTGGLVVRAPAGLGKTRLLRAAEERATARGVAVLGAAGDRFEQLDAWGVARALLGTGVADEREAITSTPSAFTEHVLGLAQRAPVLLVLDDAHWADAASLRCVLHLLSRTAEAPVAVLLATRPDDAGDAQLALDLLAAHPAVRTVGLQGLTVDGVRALAGWALDGSAPDSADALSGEAWALTAGNPFLLGRVLDAAALELAAERPVTGRLRELAEPSLRALVSLRLAEAGESATRVAEAVTVLGEHATVRRVSDLAELEPGPTAVGTDVLVRSGLLSHGEPLRFVQPLFAAAVRGGLSQGASSRAHARAARLLAQDALSADAVAAHLEQAPLGADPWVVEQLVVAADHALRRGDAGVAVRLLGRALDEPPARTERADVLVALARAHAAAGSGIAGATFREALDLTEDPVRRAEVRRDEGRWLFTVGRTREAAQAYLQARSELEGVAFLGDLDQELRAAYLGVAHFDVELRPLVDRELQTLLATGEEGRSAAERALLAQIAFQQTFAAAPRREVRALCDRAWSAGALLADEGADGDTWTLVAGVLYWLGDLEQSLAVVAAAEADAERTGSPLAQATVAWCRGPALLHRGDVSRALGSAEAALDARRIGWARHLGSLHRLHARCLIERGEVEAAQATLELAMDDPALQHSGEWSLLLEARGRTRLLCNDPAGALTDFIGAGERARQGSFAELPSILPWRSSAALALRELGEQDRALELLAEELALAERAGVDRCISTALRIRGRVEGGREGLASLEAAVAAMSGTEPRLERTHALIDLGAALRRANRRREAERPLREALAACEAGGATAPAERARASWPRWGCGRARRATRIPTCSPRASAGWRSRPRPGGRTRRSPPRCSSPPRPSSTTSARSSASSASAAGRSCAPHWARRHSPGTECWGRPLGQNRRRVSRNRWMSSATVDRSFSSSARPCSRSDACQNGAVGVARRRHGRVRSHRNGDDRHPHRGVHLHDDRRGHLRGARWGHGAAGERGRAEGAELLRAGRAWRVGQCANPRTAGRHALRRGRGRRPRWQPRRAARATLRGQLWGSANLVMVARRAAVPRTAGMPQDGGPRVHLRRRPNRGDRRCVRRCRRRRRRWRRGRGTGGYASSGKLALTAVTVALAGPAGPAGATLSTARRPAAASCRRPRMPPLAAARVARAATAAAAVAATPEANLAAVGAVARAERATSCRRPRTSAWARRRPGRRSRSPRCIRPRRACMPAPPTGGHGRRPAQRR